MSTTADLIAGMEQSHRSACERGKLEEARRIAEKLIRFIDRERAKRPLPAQKPS